MDTTGLPAPPGVDERWLVSDRLGHQMIRLIRLVERAKQTTSDHDILRRRFLPLDFDAVRPSGISSTEAEHEAALARAYEGFLWLIDLGFPRTR